MDGWNVGRNVEELAEGGLTPLEETGRKLSPAAPSSRQKVTGWTHSQVHLYIQVSVVVLEIGILNCIQWRGMKAPREV